MNNNIKKKQKKTEEISGWLIPKICHIEILSVHTSTQYPLQQRWTQCTELASTTRRDQGWYVTYVNLVLPNQPQGTYQSNWFPYTSMNAYFVPSNNIFLSHYFHFVHRVLIRKHLNNGRQTEESIFTINIFLWINVYRFSNIMFLKY